MWHCQNIVRARPAIIIVIICLHVVQLSHCHFAFNPLTGQKSAGYKGNEEGASCFCEVCKITSSHLLQFTL